MYIGAGFEWKSLSGVGVLVNKLNTEYVCFDRGVWRIINPV